LINSPVTDFGIPRPDVTGVDRSSRMVVIVFR